MFDVMTIAQLLLEFIDSAFVIHVMLTFHKGEEAMVKMSGSREQKPSAIEMTRKRCH
jgi:hypothetical protein